MPCYDHRDSPSYIREHELQPLQERVDQLSQWLCAAMLKMPVQSQRELPPELLDWWHEHRKFDLAKGE